MGKTILVSDIIKFLNTHVISVLGDFKGVCVHHLKPLELIDEYTLDWVNPTRIDKQEMTEDSKARAILVDKNVVFTDSIKKSGKILLQVESPRLCFSMIAQKFFAPKPEMEINQDANINPEANISANVHIGAGVAIGKSSIGEGTVIHPNVTVYDNVVIGKNCLIQAGAVIGTDGLGCQRLEDGTLVKFPHLGGVVLGDNVEIGANSQIARGALSNTIIKNGVKLNGLCFIAHNCILEENVWITGNTMLAGSVHVKQNTTIYSSVTIREQRVIGKGVTIGMGSIVTKDIPDNEIWYGNPAKKVENGK